MTIIDLMKNKLYFLITKVDLVFVRSKLFSKLLAKCENIQDVESLLRR